MLTEEIAGLSTMQFRCLCPKNLALGAKGYRLPVENYHVFYVLEGHTA